MHIQMIKLQIKQKKQAYILACTRHANGISKLKADVNVLKSA